MATFGKNSIKNRDQCDSRLQLILNAAIQFYDFSVVCGHRTKADQDAAFAAGVSKLKYPNSKHNSSPSKAFDVYPFHPIYGSLTEDSAVIKRIQSRIDKTPPAVREFIHQEYCVMAGVILTVAKKLQVKIRWGGDWNCDGNRLDNSFNDLAHFELAE